MTKHAKKSSHLQAVDRTKTATVEIPLPLLGAFAGIERSDRIRAASPGRAGSKTGRSCVDRGGNAIPHARLAARGRRRARSPWAGVGCG